jgi:Holliday junction resolvasome RuvABC DNA-binding subunit
VVEALVNLGYKRALAERAVERVLSDGERPERESLLRLALASIREV